MRNIENYKRIFVDTLLLKKEEVENASILDTEQWDSLEHFNLVNQIEETFGVKFSNEDIIDFVSYHSGIEILKKYGVILEIV